MRLLEQRIEGGDAEGLLENMHLDWTGWGEDSEDEEGNRIYNNAAAIDLEIDVLKGGRL